MNNPLSRVIMMNYPRSRVIMNNLRLKLMLRKVTLTSTVVVVRLNIYPKLISTYKGNQILNSVMVKMMAMTMKITKMCTGGI